MSEPQPAGYADHSGSNELSDKAAPKIHRVCIGCNNMFEVTMDHIDAKHCSACHKG